MSLREKGVWNIEMPSEDWKGKAKEKWNSVAKPLGSLGALETIISNICAMRMTTNISLERKAVAVFCADNGVVAEGVTQTGSDITTLVAKNICLGEASICTMSKIAGADVFAVDIGMNTALDDERIVNMRLSSGTGNIAKGAAMSREDAERAIENGIIFAMELSAKGYDLFATGEMGIGNTTTSSAVASVLLGKEPHVMTGMGAGLSSEGIKNKIRVIERAIEVNKPDKNDGIEVIEKLGGYDIAGMTGFFLGCAICKKPCIIDGFISSVAALCAARINPHSISYMIASHVSDEPASLMVLEELGLKAIINANMRLGEGTGAVTIMPILDMAVAIFNEGNTFEDVEMEAYKPLK